AIIKVANIMHLAVPVDVDAPVSRRNPRSFMTISWQTCSIIRMEIYGTPLRFRLGGKKKPRTAKAAIRGFYD
ncbi:MAG: hypothetical protein ACKO9V_04985, partial [Candidatus Kapaibacterium sp.]